MLGLLTLSLRWLPLYLQPRTTARSQPQTVQAQPRHSLSGRLQLGVSIPENTRETPVMIVSELCSNGDLFDYIRNVPAPSLKKVVRIRLICLSFLAYASSSQLNIILDIARGMEYLHLRKLFIIHRDCKSSNTFITSRGTAKMADFGLARVKQSTLMSFHAPWCTGKCCNDTYPTRSSLGM